MHSRLASLHLKDLELERSQLIEKANLIRTQLCQDARALQPLVSNGELALGLVRNFKRSNMALPALFGLGIGGIAAIAVPKPESINLALKWAPILVNLAQVFRRLDDIA